MEFFELDDFAMEMIAQLAEGTITAEEATERLQSEGNSLELTIAD